ncbi:MAG: hypothetical protein RL584_513 [Pseudomonadota bacterium]
MHYLHNSGCGVKSFRDPLLALFAHTRYSRANHKPGRSQRPTRGVADVQQLQACHGKAPPWVWKLRPKAPQ